MTETTQSGASRKELICPKCESLLPAERIGFSWCECGWNLPSDPMDEWRGWRRRWGGIIRRLGKLQADSDAAWLRREGAQNRLGWHLLTFLVLLLGPLSFLFQLGLLLLVVGCVVFAIRLLRDNCVVSVILLVAVFGVWYLWRPDRSLWRLRRRNRGFVNIEQDRVLPTVIDVAKRLKLSAPTATAFTPLPYVTVLQQLVWTFPPRIERVFVVGLPVLAVMNQTEFKAVAGHVLTILDGARAWFLPAADRVLRWCCVIMQVLLRLVEGGVKLALVVLALVVACSLLFVPVLGTADFFQSIVDSGVFVYVVLPLLFAVGTVLFGVLLWLAALWYRRDTLLADRKVAEPMERMCSCELCPSCGLHNAALDCSGARCYMDGFREKKT